MDVPATDVDVGQLNCDSGAEKDGDLAQPLSGLSGVLGAAAGGTRSGLILSIVATAPSVAAAASERGVDCVSTLYSARSASSTDSSGALKPLTPKFVTVLSDIDFP